MWLLKVSLVFDLNCSKSFNYVEPAFSASFPVPWVKNLAFKKHIGSKYCKDRPHEFGTSLYPAFGNSKWVQRASPILCRENRWYDYLNFLIGTSYSYISELVWYNKVIFRDASGKPKRKKGEIHEDSYFRPIKLHII